MVPKRSDHYLDLLHFHEVSKECVLKQTMVNQENMFRNQVQELHRVYQMQMLMMKNSRSKEMSETQYMNYSQDDLPGKWSQRFLNNREFPNSDYSNHRTERFIHKGNGLGTQEKPIDVDRYFHGETKPRTEELSLSLNINGGGHVSCMSGKKFLEEKATPAFSLHIINLEESSGSFFKKEQEPGSEFAGGSITNNIHEGNSGSTKRSLSFLDAITDFRGKSCLNQDNEEMSGPKVSVLGEICTTSKAKLLDLNEPPWDDSSFYVNDPTRIHSPAISASAAVLEEELVVGCQERMILDSKCCVKPIDNNQTPPGRNDNGGSNLRSIDLESCGKVASENSDDQECLTSDSRHEDEFGLKSVCCRDCNADDDSVGKADADMSLMTGNPSNTLKTAQYTSNLQLECEQGLKSGCINSNVEEDSVEIADFDMPSIFNNPSNSLKTMHSTSNLQLKGKMGLISGCRNRSLEEKSVEKAIFDMSPLSSNPSNTLKKIQSVAYSEISTPVVNSIQSSESSQIDSLGIGDEQSELDENLIRRGAVSLLYFMLENSSSTGQKNHPINENQQEHSLDSFESAVLKLQESKSDDFNDVSSDHYEIKDINGEKDSPIKLRRGRRMKDFQKDILPSMSSLSRHEICEDVRLMEGVIRSREYKRLRSKDSGDQKWCTPVKSRRSRINNIGRKSFYREKAHR